MRSLIAFIFFVLPMAALADACPKPGDPVTASPYTTTFKCPMTSIIVNGETMGAGQGCSPAKETAYYTNGGKLLPLPAVNSLFSKSDGDFSSRIWHAAKAHCQLDHSIIIDYWTEGGCVGCERSVQYFFGVEGSLQKATLLQP